MSTEPSLAQRRAELVARCDQQRAELSAQAKTLCASMTLGGIAADVLATVKQHKWLIAGATLATVWVKPRRLVSGMKTGLLAWQTWRNLLPVWQNLRQPF